MTERFVLTAGRISIGTGESTIVGIGTTFRGIDLEAAEVWVQWAGKAAEKVGTIAAATPRGVYENLSLPLVSPWNGDAITNQSYELIYGPAVANGASQAAILARFVAAFENNIGGVGNKADALDYSLIPNNTLIPDAVTRTIYQWRNGTLNPIYAIGAAFAPRGAWSSATTYAANDLVQYGTGVFISNSDDNVNHAPTISPVPTSDANWTYLPLPSSGDFFDLAILTIGKPGDGDLLARYEFTSTVVFPAGLTISRGSAGGAATGSAVVTLNKNGVAFGTVTFAASSATGAFAAASDTPFTAGDILTAYGPSTSDLTLADISITLMGTRDAAGPIDQKGIATLDFGAFPGGGDASIVITGQSRIDASSLVSAWLWPGAGTTDHSADEHVVAGMAVRVSDVVPGIGFTIRGVCTELEASRHYGQWNVAWRID